MLRRFVGFLKEGKLQTEAARLAGSISPASYAAKSITHEFVAAEMAQHRRLQQEAERKAAEADALKPVVTRRRIEEMLLHEAQNAGTDGARVRALIALADIKGMKITRTLDLGPELEKASDEELDQFGKYGYIEPAKTVYSGRSGVGKGEGQSPAGTAETYRGEGR
jgi:hypothetical protein